VAIDSGHWPRWPVVRPTDNSASIILTPEQILATWAGHMAWPGLAWPGPPWAEQCVDGSDSGHRQWPLAMLAGGSANRYSASIILTPEQILATWAGHMGWPNGMATRDLDDVAPEQCALSTGATVAIESVHICIEPKRWLAQHRWPSAATHPHTATTINFG
jgi:hypothetical protein